MDSTLPHHTDWNLRRSGLRLLVSLIASTAFATFAHPLCEQARKLDPLGDRKPRETIEGALRVGACGVQIHPYCFKIAAQAKISRKEAEAKLTDWILQSFDKVMNACHGEFPEFDPYLVEWVTQMRRTVITCSDQESKDLEQAAGVTFAHGASVMVSSLPAEATEGMSIGLFNSHAADHQMIQYYPKDTWQKMLKSFDWVNDGSIENLIHEGLHATRANNRSNSDHKKNNNQTQNGEYGPDSDRVYSISKICTYAGGGTPHFGVDLLAARMKNHGGVQSCVDVFTKNNINFWERPYFRSHPLARSKAVSACEKMMEWGQCGAVRNQSGATLTRNNPVLQYWGVRISDRLQEMFPKYTHHIPRQALTTHPQIQATYLAVRDTACFQWAYNDTPQGLYARGVSHRVINSKEVLDPIYLYSHLDDLKTQVRTRTDTHHRCSTDESSQVEQLLRQVQKYYYDAQSDQVYIAAVRPRAQNTAELYATLPGTKVTDELKTLLGPSFLNEYFQALADNHHLSPQYDCRANGFMPKTVAREQARARHAR